MYLIRLLLAKLRWIPFIASFVVYSCCLALPDHTYGQDHIPPTALPTLESFELVGTSRIDKQTLTDDFGLTVGTKLDDEFVMATRQKLLGLGLFRNVLLLLRKGSQAGQARLIIEVEDDERVLSSWALGGAIGLFYNDASENIGPDSDHFNYELNLVSRNLFRSLHRGSLSVNFDSSGRLREGKIAYGLPRAAQEDVQFDVEASLVDVRTNYLDAMGYGGKVQGLWTRSTGAGDIFFGPAMYVNRPPRFGYDENPDATAGPRLGYTRETRLLGFVPGSGYGYSVSILGAVDDYDLSLIEAQGAYTFDFRSLLFWTIDARGLAIGDRAYSLRGESRFDVPLSVIHARAPQSANLFVRLRSGRDKTSKRKYVGSSAIIGVQYFSSGFIASFGIQVTQSPNQILDYQDPGALTSGGLR